MRAYQILIIIFTLLGFEDSLAQNRNKDTIDDQRVNVVKPYTPTVSDAFKIRELPLLNDSNTVRKKQIKYNIFSIPVASTFTPAKGKAANVDKPKRIKIFDNYASLGFGTYTTFLGELYLNHEVANDQYFGSYFSHHSSFGDIEGVLLDNDFTNTELNLDFTQNSRDFSWKVELGGDFQTYNWYGLPVDLVDPDQISDIDPGHSFYSFHAGGRLLFDEGILKESRALFRHFADSEDSSENYFLSQTELSIPIADSKINTDLDVEYLSGSFSRNFLTMEGLDYGFLAVSLAPSYVLVEDDLTINLGVNLVYQNDIEQGDNNFYIYPNIEASYRLVSDVVVAYGGITGDLNQNTYHDFANENPFVSPTLLVNPTDQRYNAFLGIKGKLSSQVSYNLKAGYSSDENRALYQLNPVQNFGVEDYQLGNSFGIVYDDVTTLSIEGELNLDFGRNFTLGLKGGYFNYSMDSQDEAWNLPDLTGSIFIDYQISEKWFAGASAFFVGKRSDLLAVNGSFINIEPEIISLDSYFDANVHLGYRINSQFNMFAKVNNIANQNYQRWANFPVQGLQFLAGATYQFDF